MKKVTAIFLFILSASCVSQSPERDITVKKKPNVSECYTVNDCASTIQKLIQNKFLVPVGVVIPDKTPILNLKLDEEGALIEVKVIETSGEAVYDQVVIDAVSKAAPFTEIKGLELNERKQLQDISLKVNHSLPKRLSK